MEQLGFSFEPTIDQTPFDFSTCTSLPDRNYQIFMHKMLLEETYQQLSQKTNLKPSSIKMIYKKYLRIYTHKKKDLRNPIPSHTRA